MIVTGRFAYIWRYTTKPSRRSEFVAAYNPKGDWAQLFSKDPSYIETVFLQDDEDEDKFVTIDYWKSRTARDAFRQQYSIEFNRLDSSCEAYTQNEELLGDYFEIGG